MITQNFIAVFDRKKHVLDDFSIIGGHNEDGFQRSKCHTCAQFQNFLKKTGSSARSKINFS